MSHEKLEDIEIPPQALVLVADGQRARLLRNTGTQRHITFVTELDLKQDNPPTHEQGSDRPGRTHTADGTSRSSVEQTDWHRQQEERFTTQVAHQLYQMFHSGHASALIVIAEPRVLGVLRSSFHSEVSSRVIAEVAKDLTSVSVKELAERFVPS